MDRVVVVDYGHFPMIGRSVVSDVSFFDRHFFFLPYLIIRATESLVPKCLRFFLGKVRKTRRKERRAFELDIMYTISRRPWYF